MFCCWGGGVVGWIGSEVDGTGAGLGGSFCFRSGGWVRLGFGFALEIKPQASSPHPLRCALLRLTIRRKDKASRKHLSGKKAHEL